MSGIRTGILNNATPLSASNISELEKQVLEKSATFAYLDTDSKLCFAMPSSVDGIKKLAWNNAYELSTEEGTFIKKAYKKTGLDNYKLDKTFTKASINDSWISDEPAATEALEGSGQEYYTMAPSSLSFRSTAPLDEFQEILVNGQTIDPANYTLEEGSTIVKLSHNYLNTLDAGGYELTVVSDKMTAKGNFTVADNADSFYYGYVYSTTFMSEFDEITVDVIFSKDNVVYIFDSSAGFVYSGSYSFENNIMSFDVQSDNMLTQAPFSGSFSDDGKVLSGTLQMTTFFGPEELGIELNMSTNSYYDGVYLYYMDATQSYYSYVAVDKSLSTYPAAKDNICGVNVVHIPTYAFRDCANLTCIEVGASVDSIDLYAYEFPYTSLTAIKVSDKNAAYKALDGNLYSKDGKTLILYTGGKAETRFAIPDDVEAIGSCAFYKCARLEYIEPGNHITYIGHDAFLDSGYYNNAANWENDILYLGKYLIDAKTDISGSIAVKEGTEVIADGAFCYCKSLTDIVIPDSMKIIAGGAFSQCSSLTTVHINDLAAWCNLDGHDSFASVPHNLCINGNLITKLSIPTGVTCIRNSAFSHNTAITEVTIPDSVTTIGDSVFSNCTALTSITVPDSVTSIGCNVFNGCTSLADITVPDNIFTNVDNGFIYNTAYYNNSDNWENDILYLGKTLVRAKKTLSDGCEIKPGTLVIASRAFQSCSKLRNIKIPASIIYIGDSAFDNCLDLLTAELGVNVHSIESNPFTKCYSLMNIIVPEENDTYKAIDGSLYTHDAKTLICYAPGRTNINVTIPDGVLHIADNAFSCCDSLPGVSIPDSVKTIGEGAFCLCSQLNSIDIGSSVTEIGSDAFYLCEGLERVVMGSSVISIGENAFANCDNIKDFEFKGTCKQWFMIKKGSMWYPSYVSDFCVQCSNGRVTL